jgi:hypothetical protein
MLASVNTPAARDKPSPTRGFRSPSTIAAERIEVLWANEKTAWP